MDCLQQEKNLQEIEQAYLLVLRGLAALLAAFATVIELEQLLRMGPVELAVAAAAAATAEADSVQVLPESLAPIPHQQTRSFEALVSRAAEQLPPMHYLAVAAVPQQLQQLVVLVVAAAGAVVRPLALLLVAAAATRAPIAH